MVRGNNDFGPQVVPIFNQTAQHGAFRVAQKKRQSMPVLRQPRDHRGIVALPRFPLCARRVQHLQPQLPGRVSQYKNIPPHKGAAVVFKTRRTS